MIKKHDTNTQYRLYNDLSWTFPIITPLEHYIEETELFCKILKDSADISLKTLLHLGCGGGHNDYVFKKHFQVAGIDKSEAMLELAKRLNSDVNYICDDMRSFQFDYTFDVIVAIDSIAYILTKEDLQKMFTAVFAHLNAGGVFMFIVEDDPNNFTQNNTTHYSTSKEGIEITFIDNRFDANPSDTMYESTFIYLIRRNNKLEIYTDQHLCGLFPINVFTELLNKTGFEVNLLNYKPPKFAIESSGLSGYEEYPMFVCKKPVSKNYINR